MIWLYAVVGAAVVALGGGVLARNRIATLRQRVANARGQIDVQLIRRHTLVPALVETVKGALAHERAALEALLAARGEADRMLHQQIERSVVAETNLEVSLGTVMAAAQAAPELRAVTSLEALQEELRTTENRIAFARQHYNDSVAQLNAAIAGFPGSLVAGGAAPAAFWRAP
jgi:LemA protein